VGAEDKGRAVRVRAPAIDFAENQLRKVSHDQLRRDQFIGQAGFLLQVIDHDTVKPGKTVLDPGCA